MKKSEFTPRMAVWKMIRQVMIDVMMMYHDGKEARRLSGWLEYVVRWSWYTFILKNDLWTSLCPIPYQSVVFHSPKFTSKRNIFSFSAFHSSTLCHFKPTKKSNHKQRLLKLNLPGIKTHYCFSSPRMLRLCSVDLHFRIGSLRGVFLL